MSLAVARHFSHLIPVGTPVLHTHTPHVNLVPEPGKILEFKLPEKEKPSVPSIQPKRGEILEGSIEVLISKSRNESVPVSSPVTTPPVAPAKFKTIHLPLHPTLKQARKMARLAEFLIQESNRTLAPGARPMKSPTVEDMARNVNTARNPIISHNIQLSENPYRKRVLDMHGNVDENTICVQVCDWRGTGAGGKPTERVVFLRPDKWEMKKSKAGLGREGR